MWSTKGNTFSVVGNRGLLSLQRMDGLRKVPKLLFFGERVRTTGLAAAVWGLDCKLKNSCY